MLKIFSLENTKKFIYFAFALGVVIFLGLLFFRFPAHDETIYLQESMIMSELFKSGNWIGAYGVGLHGFLFKLPVALIFIFTGPSALVATIYNYLLCVIALILVYKIANMIFKNHLHALIVVLMTMFGFEFVRSAPTYLREIPSLISVLLFSYLYLKNSKNYILSFALMLVLDAKEYMFFIVGLSFTLSEFIRFIFNERTFKSFINFVINQLIVYAVPVIYLILMFTTAVIPVNMFVASIIGLIDRGLGWNAQQFSVNSGSGNVVNSGDIKEIFRFSTSNSNNILNWIAKFLNIIFGYVGKFLYPRSFSFISIPKLIALPSFVFAFIYLKKWIKNKDRNILLPVTIFVFLLIFILRSSHGRYLFPILPFVLIFFIKFLLDIPNNFKLLIGILAVTWLSEIFGLYFETSMVIVKSFISLTVFISLLIYFYLQIKHPKYNHVFLTLIALFISGVTTLSSLSFMYTQGQIGDSINFGREYEVTKIVTSLSNYEGKIYMNENQTTKLIHFYIKETYINPLWVWKLKSYLPKSNIVTTASPQRLFYVAQIPYELLKEDKSILVIFESMVKGVEYQNQKSIKSLLNDDRIRLIQKVELKGKNMYIFENNENNN